MRQIYVQCKRLSSQISGSITDRYRRGRPFASHIATRHMKSHFHMLFLDGSMSWGPVERSSNFAG